MQFDFGWLYDTSIYVGSWGLYSERGIDGGIIICFFYRKSILKHHLPNLCIWPLRFDPFSPLSSYWERRQAGYKLELPVSPLLPIPLPLIVLRHIDLAQCVCVCVCVCVCIRSPYTLTRFSQISIPPHIIQQLRNVDKTLSPPPFQAICLSLLGSCSTHTTYFLQNIVLPGEFLFFSHCTQHC